MTQTVPAFIDLQVNGHGGVDLLAAKTTEDIRRVSRSLLSQGVGAYLPTLITGPLLRTVEVMKLIEEVRRSPKDDEAEVIGIHLEGPFLSPEKPGVHPTNYLSRPTQELLGEYLSAGTVTMITLAPEIPGALDAIKFLTQMGVIVSLGHSNATTQEAHAGFDAGATTVTHIWNAMSKDQTPGVGLAGVALEREEIAIQLIVDGVHLTDDLVRYTVENASDRFIVTNDAVSPAGLGEGTFPFGTFMVTVRDGRAVRSDGVLAGGVGSLKESFQRLLTLGVPFDSVLASMTTRPATLIGRPDLGVLSLGGKVTVV
ncbi:MAG: amidohydrolase family protein [Candidatus Nanopelagicaceae bacterium]|jgi:N-acetylglucosamine-6-phosphate deacetylase